MLHDEEVPIPPTIRTKLEGWMEDIDLGARRTAKVLLVGKLLFTAASFGLIFGFVRRFDLTSGPGYASLCGVGFFVALIWLWPHQKDSGNVPPDVAKARIQEKLDRDVILKRRLTLTEEQVWIEHEHGILLWVPADDRRTLLLDISSVMAGDERWPIYEDGTLFRRQWAWYQFPGEGRLVHEFTSTGETFEPVKLGEHSDEAMELFQQFGAGDGDVIDRPWPEVRAEIRGKLGR